MPTKLDLKKTHKTLYTAPTAEPVLVQGPALSALMIDGAGNPNTSPAYGAAVEALFAVAYKIKFTSKAAGIDYGVLPMEGLWWTEDMADFSVERKDDWLWTMLIVQPDHITPEIFAAAVDEVRAKKNPAALDRLRLDTLHEPLAAQIMHIGPYAAEAPTIAQLHAWITAQGYTFHNAGHHHEIYLSDPRRTAPEKLKTIIRQPVRKAD